MIDMKQTFKDVMWSLLLAYCVILSMGLAVLSLIAIFEWVLG